MFMNEPLSLGFESLCAHLFGDLAWEPGFLHLVQVWILKIKKASDRMARSHFYDVIDIVPTILEVVRVLEQTKLDGIPQKEIGGRRMGYTLTAADKTLLEAWAAHYKYDGRPKRSSY